MPPEIPHLDHPDLQPDTKAASDLLRASAAKAANQPTLERLSRAMSLLHQMRGFIAAKRLELPIDVDREFVVLAHEDLLARKEQRS
jgi:hypothetical protein